MYNHGEGELIFVANMRFRQHVRIAVIAALLVSPFTLHAQRMGTPETVPDTITSITNLKTIRHPAAPFGSIDASADASVISDVTVTPDPESSEISNQQQSGRAAGHTLHQANASSQFAVSKSAVSTNQRASTGSNMASTFQSPSSQQLPQSAQQLRSVSSQAVYAPSAELRQASSKPSLRASYAQSMQSVEANPRREPKAESGRSSASNGMPQTGSVQGELGSSMMGRRFRDGDLDSGGKGRSSHNSLSAIPSDYAAGLNVTRRAGETSAAGSNKPESQRLFEAIDDPFSSIVDLNFESPNSDRELESACGAACSITHAGASKAGTAETEQTTTLLDQRSNGEAQETTRQPLSSLERLEGRLTDDTPRSDVTVRLGSHSRMRPGSREKVLRNSLNPTVRKESAD